MVKENDVTVLVTNLNRVIEVEQSDIDMLHLDASGEDVIATLYFSKGETCRYPVVKVDTSLPYEYLLKHGKLYINEGIRAYEENCKVHAKNLVFEVQYG